MNKKINTMNAGMPSLDQLTKIQAPQIEKIVQQAPQMKQIKNLSVQGHHLVLAKGNDYDQVWLPPKKSILVEESQITNQVRNLHKRRLIIIENT